MSNYSVPWKDRCQKNYSILILDKHIPKKQEELQPPSL